MAPLFLVSVAAKGLSWVVSLLFATLAWRAISVAAKGLKAIVGGSRWTVVSREKDREGGLERREPFPTRSESSIEAPLEARGKQGKRARMAFNIHGRE
jgi:hypothetical protein